MEIEIMNTHAFRVLALASVAAISFLSSCSSSSVAAEKAPAPSPASASSTVATFDTPEKAMSALENVIGTHDPAAVARLFGPDGADVLHSGDPVADEEDAQRVKEALREKIAFEDTGPGSKIAVLGHEEWPFPIPLVRVEGRWRFDIDAGREEIANRRIGRDEIDTIASMHAYVDAQREYLAQGRDGRTPSYAQKVLSSAGKHDGLYWPTTAGEPESPLGPLIAAADREGYKLGTGEPAAYHGYYYRTLSAQGKSAPGGARSYLDDTGAMTRGFALLAWPAKYGNSGVMTFVVDAQGIVFQKDLGPDTETEVAKIQAYDPDDSWNPTGD
jgi:hypothetical protein